MVASFDGFPYPLACLVEQARGTQDKTTLYAAFEQWVAYISALVLADLGRAPAGVADLLPCDEKPTAGKRVKSLHDLVKAHGELAQAQRILPDLRQWFQQLGPFDAVRERNKDAHDWENYVEIDLLRRIFISWNETPNGCNR